MDNAHPDMDKEDPAWWDQEPTEEDRLHQRQTVEDYLAFHGDNVEHLKFGMALVKQMIPHLAVRDAKWQGFPKARLDIQDYVAH